MEPVLLLTVPDYAVPRFGFAAVMALRERELVAFAGTEDGKVRLVELAPYPAESVIDVQELAERLESVRSAALIGSAREVQALAEALDTEGLATEIMAADDATGWRLADAVAVMDRLRGPGGCPWDGEQTHESLLRYLLEESYETVEAVEAGDQPGMVEELGDVLLQVLFHARIGEEEQPAFSIDDVADGLVTKLVRRHPHVFADTEVSGSGEVATNWEAIKRAEKGRTSVTDGVPLAQPALPLAATLIDRAGRIGLDPHPHSTTAPGDELLALIARMRADGLDPETELRHAARRLYEAIRAAEAGSQADGQRADRAESTT